MERAQECLLPGSPEERCSLEVMESCYKELCQETCRAKCSQLEQQQIDDLWRLIKMVYNGATRQEALAARNPQCIADSHVAQVYAKVLLLLKPSSAESKECSLQDLQSAHLALKAKEVQTEFSQAQNQIVDHLCKVIQYVKEGDNVHASIKKAWEQRDAAAHTRLLHASKDFTGMYPSGGADAFAHALECLSPGSADEQCSLQAMETAFQELDSELVRNECSQAQQNVVDDLWRLIKMMYNGATRQEALAARCSQEIAGNAASKAYNKVLQYLNPFSAESVVCSVGDLESAYEVLGAASVRTEFSGAQNQVVDQLQKAIKGAQGTVSVQASILKAWTERNDAARMRLG